MEDWIKFKDEKPPVGVEVEVMYSGRILKSKWGVKNLIDGVVVTAWELDPRGQAMPMYWRHIIK
jgi:hypothetical protein